MLFVVVMVCWIKRRAIFGAAFFLVVFLGGGWLGVELGRSVLCRGLAVLVAIKTG